MSGSASRRRREGREAYHPGGDPAALNPYKASICDAADWRVGWAEAERDEILRKSAQDAADLAEFEAVQEFARLYNLAKEQGLIA